MLLFFSCCCSSCIVIPLALPFFPHCCPSHYSSHATTLMLLLSHYSFRATLHALFLLHYCFHTTTPISSSFLLHYYFYHIIFSLYYSFHVIVPFTLLFSNHHTFHLHVTLAFVILLVLSLLFLSCNCSNIYPIGHLLSHIATKTQLDIYLTYMLKEKIHPYNRNDPYNDF